MAVQEGCIAGPDHLPKEPFDIDLVFARLREACATLPRAALFALRDQGYASPFEILAGALISVRTRDETTLPVSQALFTRARSPAALQQIPEAALAALLKPATFAEVKAHRLREISVILLERYGGRVPSDLDALESLPGVGPKVAGLVLGIAFGIPAIAVDIHVHRVANRWGYITAKTPEQSEAQLRAKLPRRYWVEINERLVPFGKFICTGQRPRCSSCPLLSQCLQVGVTAHR
ncbi:MAG TPA: endonuclease III [Armatimonadota bacterium]|nr:endonuclease III [Armatimonadota bacterium]